jgi:signal recognition particle GTPase
LINLIQCFAIDHLTIGLSRSRDRLLAGISDSFAVQDNDISKTLTKLEDVLLQADIGVATTNVIIEDLRSYAKREGLTKDDILPVLRARLVEALTPPSASR